MDRIAPVVKKHKYVPLRKVGFGSFGQAWLVGQDDGKGRLNNYVCKMIDISRCSRKEKQDALHEASVLRDLKHPYIVRYKESFLEDGWLCIVQEFCEGGDLYQRIQKAKKLHQPFSEEQITRWFTQCMLGLKYIHEKHILHRDLKSSNFFLTRSGDIKMGDFGIAKVLECTAGVAKTQIGTPYYLSPEICQEKPYAWPSDIWSMGCILYELACLRVPFDAADLRALVHRITKGPSPSLPSHFSKDLRQLQSDILVRDHNKRPTAAEILSRGILQDKVRKMLAEQDKPVKKADGDKKSGDGGAGDSADGAGGNGAGALKKDGLKGQYVAEAGTYLKNQIVEYYSETHKEWLPAQVTAIDADGRIQVHCKPNAWLSLSTQAQKVRPKRNDGNKENKPRPGQGTPQMAPGSQKSGVPTTAGAGPPRSSSYHTPRYNSGAGGGAGGGSNVGGAHGNSPSHGGAFHRQATPPHYGAGYRVGSSSPFGGGRGTPRLAYGRPLQYGGPGGGGGGTPRGMAMNQVGTPRGGPGSGHRGQSPSLIRPPMHGQNSPRFNSGVPTGNAYGGGGGYSQNRYGGH